MPFSLLKWVCKSASNQLPKDGQIGRHINAQSDQHFAFHVSFQERWCGREDSNFHGCYPTATSTLRVYQFRHDRTSRLGDAALDKPARHLKRKMRTYVRKLNLTRRTCLISCTKTGLSHWQPRSDCLCERAITTTGPISLPAAPISPKLRRRGFSPVEQW